MCASNVNCSPGVIDVYDSLPACMTKTALTKLKEQLAAILCTSDRVFENRLVDVQHQSGASDCALFAVALQKSMQEHLRSAFEEGELVPCSPCTQSEATGVEKSCDKGEGSIVHVDFPGTRRMTSGDH